MFRKAYIDNADCVQSRTPYTHVPIGYLFYFLFHVSHLHGGYRIPLYRNGLAPWCQTWLWQTVQHPGIQKILLLEFGFQPSGFLILLLLRNPLMRFDIRNLLIKQRKINRENINKQTNYFIRKRLFRICVPWELYKWITINMEYDCQRGLESGIQKAGIQHPTHLLHEVNRAV